MALGPIIDLLNHDAAPTCEVVQVEGGAGDDDGGGALVIASAIGGGGGACRRAIFCSPRRLPVLATLAAAGPPLAVRR